MKTTIDLPDDVMIAARKAAAERRTSLKELFERALRRELGAREEPDRSRPTEIRWVTAKGGLPPGLDLESRDEMHQWLARERRR